MRYGAEHKAESKGRILECAARQIRAKGPHKVSVAEVMSAAGLTHGAFYAHFASKDALVAEAVSEMFSEAADRAGGLRDLAAFEGEALRKALRDYLDGYLSSSHRDRPDRGCPLPSLASDMTRSGAAARKNFSAGIDLMTGRIGMALTRLGRASPDNEARAIVARMVGALSLARAIGPGAESDAILRDSRDAIFQELGL
jgi:TetR/AcrR family transcriptional repressor of nem operon